LFWPLKFLPLEPDVCLARILTFGYNANFRAAGNVSTSVLDFAKDLLFDLKYAKDEQQKDLDIGNVSNIRRSGLELKLNCIQVPLVFVVHSMGGLIIKEVKMPADSTSATLRMFRRTCKARMIPSTKQ
jgi:hypothetical protein